MEDALVLVDKKRLAELKISLNPCFNGRCTRTITATAANEVEMQVLILVLMEDALVPHVTSYHCEEPEVLILVLMEDALVLS